MTNYEKIINELNIEKLADFLISEVVENNGDWGFDGEDEYWIDNYEIMFATQANNKNKLYWSYEDALEDTVEWLKREYTDGSNIQE